nr:thiamine diphosphokinase [Amylibacter sp.]
MENFRRIVHSASSVTLLGGGSARKCDLKESLTLAPLLVCADGGANHARKWGVTPAGIIGDMDSYHLDPALETEIPLLPVSDQNSTDFEKCLAVLTAPVVLGVGFLGKRLDHQLAALNALCKHPGRAIVLIGKKDVVFRAPPRFAMQLAAETRVSLHPITGVQANSTGLVWPVAGLDFQPDGQIGSSNAALGGAFVLEIVHGDLLVMLPRKHLKGVVQALRAGLE